MTDATLSALFLIAGPCCAYLTARHWRPLPSLMSCSALVLLMWATVVWPAAPGDDVINALYVYFFVVPTLVCWVAGLVVSSRQQ